MLYEIGISTIDPALGWVVSMHNRRDREEIMARILSICLEGVHKTRIIYMANINTSTNDIYLEYLIQKKLIEKIQGQPPLYKTTLDGIRLLERLQYVNKRLRR